MSEKRANSGLRVILGFDYGRRRTGLAVGNTETGTVTPLATLTSVRGAPDWDGIAGIIAEWTPDALVLGDPLGDPERTGSATGTIRDEIDRFRRALVNRFGLPVFTIDETLSSDEAYRQLTDRRRAGSRRSIRRGDIDRVAAALLLETWMNNRPETDGALPE